jgi:ABC-type uncharacterized transport system substrate-binding protein
MGCSFAWAAPQDSPAEDNSVVVLYPTAPSPEREVYGLIREAIADTLHRHRQRAAERPAQGALAPAALALKDAHPRAVISLGRVGYQVADAADEGVPWIAGALQVQDADTRGKHPPTAAVSLTPDPRSLLEGLKHLAPKITRILAAYNPDHSELYIEAARSASRALKISFVALPAHDLREASAHYYNILRYANPETDALWLVEGDGLVDLEGTLPSMIQSAWAARFVIVSNIAEHARRGALLSAYPDPPALGRQLASLALEALDGKQTEPLQYGSSLVFVVNPRVASHLGLDTTALTRDHHAVLVGEQ